jgi:hypothetical protein
LGCAFYNFLVYFGGTIDPAWQELLLGAAFWASVFIPAASAFARQKIVSMLVRAAARHFLAAREWPSGRWGG